MKNKIISLILTFSLLVSVLAILPTTAWAAWSNESDIESALTAEERNAAVITVKAGADGTLAAPLEIWNAAQLSDFAAKVNSGAKVGDSDLYFTQAAAKLMADIAYNEGYTFILNENFLVEVKDASGIISYMGTGKGATAGAWYQDAAGKTAGTAEGFTKPANFTPIGSTKAQAYLSTFDGNNHKISGIFCTEQGTNAAGLFGYAGTNVKDKVVIKNVSIVGACIVNEGSSGGIVGYLYNNINDPTTTSSKCDHSDNVCDRGFTTALSATTEQKSHSDILTYTLTSCNNVKSIVASSGSNVGGILGEAGFTYHYAQNCYYRNSTYNSSNSLVNKCSNSATVIGNSAVGGIAGNAGIAVLDGAVNRGTVYGKGDYVAGIAGKSNNCTLNDLTNHGNVTSSGSYVAGITGQSFRSPYNALNTGKISGKNYVAGIMSEMRQAGAGYGVENCANLGDIIASGSYAAGMVATFYKTVNTNKVKNVYNFASVTAATSGTAAVFAIIPADSTATSFTFTVDKAYSVGGVAFLDASGKNLLATTTENYSTEITAEQVKNGELSSMLSGFIQNPSFPYPIPPKTVVFNDLAGAGTDADPYRIYTSSDLYEFASRVNNGYVDELGNAINSKEISAILMNDINVNEGYTFGYIPENGLVSVEKNGITAYVGTGINGSAIATWYKDTNKTSGIPEGFEKPAEWTPIGTDVASYFSGNFDGQGYSVKGIFVASNSANVGFFGYVGGLGDDCKIDIKNLSIINSAIIGASNVGGLIGSVNSNVGDTSIEANSAILCNHTTNPNCRRGFDLKCNITNCHNEGTVVTGVSGNVGGLVGFGGGRYHHYITNSNSTATKVNSYGAIDSVANCSNSGTVANGTGDYTGGVIGNAARVKNLKYLTNTANVYSNGRYVAGITSNKPWGNTASNLINTGDITGKDYTSGIVGYSLRGMEKCLNTGNVSGTIYVAGIVAYHNTSGYSMDSLANTGNITASGDYASGVMAQITAGARSITNSYNTGTITAANYAAPILATPSAAITVTLTNVYSTGGAYLASNNTATFTEAAGNTYINTLTKSQVANGELAIRLGSSFGQSKNDSCPIPGSADVVKWALVGANLNLAADIKANLYILTNNSISTTADVHVTLNGKTEIISVSSLAAKDGYYVLTVDTAAKEMTDEITVSIYNGTTEVGFARKYSVKQYADSALSENSVLNADAKALVNALLAYGGAAQRYFNHNVNKLASSYVPEVTLPEVAKQNVVSGDVEYYGSTIILDGELTARHYFLGAKDGISFTVNGKTVSCVDGVGYCYVDVKIVPSDIANVHTVTAGTTSVSYSVLNYLSNMQNDETLSELIATIYDYYLKAVTYSAPVSTLASISIDGIEIPDFASSINNYEATVLEAPEYPLVSAAPSVSGGNVTIEQATAQNGGVATITVTSPNGSATTVYKVEMTMVESFEVNTVIEKAKDGAGSIVVIVHDDGDQPTATYLANEFEENDLRGTIALVTNRVCTVDAEGNRTLKQSAIDFWQGILDTGRFSMSSHTRNHAYWGRTDNGDSGEYYRVAGDASTLVPYTTTAGSITREVAGSQEDLRVCFPSQRVLTFVKAGFGVNVDGTQITEAAFDIIKQYYITMRNTGGGVTNIPTPDPYNIASYMVNNTDSSETLISYTDSAMSRGGMIVYLFHGISGNLQTESSELFEYIGNMQEQNKVWCATFEEASLYTEEYRTAKASATRYFDRIELTVTDTWDNEIYNHALTVRVEVPENWTSVTQTVGGVATTLEVMKDANGSFVYASVVPDSGIAIITPNN